MADRKVQIIVDVVTGKSGASSTKAAVSDVEREVIASQKRVQAGSKQTDKVIADSKKTLTREAINQEKIHERSHNNYLRSLENSAKTTATRMRSTFTDVFAGTFLGMSAASAASAGFSKLFSGLQTAFQKSLDFSTIKTSLAQFEGSMSSAEDRIKSLMKVAQETPGLGFLSAVEGQKRLMGVGFAGELATKILTGLAKVRVMSGATQEDMDAMIVNLVQIASGGQRVTQELREMATRMPFIVQVIKKEFGDIGGAINDIDPKVFVERLATAMSDVQADANQTGLAVENLQDSFDRLYIAIGSIIEQNPEVVAAITTFTKMIDGNTDALLENDSATRKSSSSWVSWAATLSVKGVNALETFGMGFQNLGRLVSAVGLSIYGTMQGIVMATLAPINLVIAGVNKLKSAIGQFAPALSMLPGGYGALAGLANMPDLQSIGPDFGSIRGTIMQKDFIMEDFWKARADQDARNRNRVQTYNSELERLRRANSPAAKNQRLMDRATLDENLNNIISGRTENAGGGVTTKPSRTGTTSKAAEAGLREFVSNRIQAEFEMAMRNLPQAMKNKIAGAAGRYGIPLELGFAQIFSESRFKPGADSGQAKGLTQFTPGTAKRFGYNIEELVKSPDKALSAWGKYMSWLFNRYGDWELATLAYHQSEETVDKLVAQLKKGAGAGASRVIGPKGKSYIAQISALSGIRGKDQFRPGDPRDVERYFADQMISTDAQISREIDLSSLEQQLSLGKQQIAVYEEMETALFNLVERTKEETFWFEYKLGKYPQFNEEQAKDIANTWALIDAKEKQSKIEAENTRQLEEYRREQEYLFEETRQGWDDLLTDLAEGNFKSIWDRMRRQMLESFIKPASTMLAQLFSGQGMQTAGGFGGQGGILGGLFGGGSMGGGSGMGPGGTPMFNPGSNFAPSASYGGMGSMGGGGFGGIGSMFGGLFGGKGGGLGSRVPGGTTMTMPNATPGAGGLMGKLGGMGGIAGMAGMGLTMAGGAIGGKTGNMLSMAGMGAMIGLQFGGPWGALIGGAIGAGAGLISMLFGRDNAEKKLKEAALNTYGITVKDKSVLKTLKALGETMFGKGNVGKNAAQVVGSDEGQLILRNYAEATNQSSSKIDQLYIGDENWKGNQFRSQFGGFRAMGGPVSAGSSYVVGERGPELFTPKQSGAVTSNADMSQMAVILGTLEETVHMLATRLMELSPGTVLSMGAKENPEAVGRAVRTDNSNSLRASEMFHRTVGAY